MLVRILKDKSGHFSHSHLQRRIKQRIPVAQLTIQEPTVGKVTVLLVFDALRHDHRLAAQTVSGQTSRRLKGVANTASKTAEPHMAAASNRLSERCGHAHARV